MWISRKTGKKGFSPVCNNEWVDGICEKPKIKCNECSHRSFAHVTDSVIREHLEGKHTIGVYLLLNDETCWFLAIDFDKESWANDVNAFMETCKSLKIPAALKRSRSGKGAHVWIFFSAPILALKARKFGSYLLTETMSRHHQLGMDSYDRLFPNQDTLPKGGFGNLIALPLQKEVCKKGNTLFFGQHFQPYEDQWAFLSSISRMQPPEVDVIVNEAERSGQVIGVGISSTGEDEEPWTKTLYRKQSEKTINCPLPERNKVVMSNLIYVEKEGLPSQLLNQIKRIAAFQNAEVDLSFHGQLTPLQQEASNILMYYEIGVFVAPPGIGKTTVGIYLISGRRRNTLVLVHRRQLIEQWRAQLASLLDIDLREIGMIGSGRDRQTGFIDVAMFQSLIQKGEVKNIVSHYGHIIVDECHHVSAFTFEQVLRKARARFILGLTATPYRRDGHQPIILMQCGPIRYKVSHTEESAKHPFQRRLICQHTNFTMPSLEADLDIHNIYAWLIADEERNQMILNDVLHVLEEGRSPILLTERREHLELLVEKLRPFVKNIIVLKGGMRIKKRNTIMENLASIPDGETRLLLATGRYAGEGFDDARLDTLFLAMPVSWKGTLVQYAGRIHRLYDGKKEVRIYDYIDSNVPMLLNMFKKRLKGYRALGYEIGGEGMG
ncbi:MAG: Type III restriction enzyme, res subunit [Candidatus Brocadia sinica]|nr:MAG: Type III restriction enzyme, res subunit [Candidatus Brocadia sinica]